MQQGVYGYRHAHDGDGARWRYGARLRVPAPHGRARASVARRGASAASALASAGSGARTGRARPKYRWSGAGRGGGHWRLRRHCCRSRCCSTATATTTAAADVQALSRRVARIFTFKDEYPLAASTSQRGAHAVAGARDRALGASGANASQWLDLAALGGHAQVAVASAPHVGVGTSGRVRGGGTGRWRGRAWSRRARCRRGAVIRSNGDQVDARRDVAAGFHDAVDGAIRSAAGARTRARRSDGARRGRRGCYDVRRRRAGG